MQAGKWHSVAVYLSSRGNLWKNFISFPCLLLQHWCCALGRGKQYTGLEVSKLTQLLLLFRCVLRWEQWKELHALPEEFRQSQTTQCLSNTDCKRWPVQPVEHTDMSCADGALTSECLASVMWPERSGSGALSYHSSSQTTHAALVCGMHTEAGLCLW